MNRIIKIILLLFLTLLLLLIRHFEDLLFYDPLISFFEHDSSSSCAIPELNSIKLFANVLLRYLMNSIISLAIIWVVFKDISIIKMSTIFYLLLFLLLLSCFSYLLFYTESKNFLPLFYVRRFLIQPLFLLVLIPAFYFQKNR